MPILKHHPAEPVTQQVISQLHSSELPRLVTCEEPTAVAAGGENPGSARTDWGRDPGWICVGIQFALPTLANVRRIETTKPLEH